MAQNSTDPEITGPEIDREHPIEWTSFVEKSVPCPLGSKCTTFVIGEVRQSGKLLAYSAGLLYYKPS